MASKEEYHSEDDEDWSRMNTGLGFTYQAGVRFKWTPLPQEGSLALEDVQDQDDWSGCYTGVGFSYQRGQRFRWTPLPLSETVKTWKSKSQRRKAAKKENKRRIALLKHQTNN